MQALRPAQADRLGTSSATSLSSRRQECSGRAQEIRTRDGDVDDAGAHLQVVEALRVSPTVHSLRTAGRYGEQVTAVLMIGSNKSNLDGRTDNAFARSAFLLMNTGLLTSLNSGSIYV